MLYCEVLFPRWNTRCVCLCFAGLSTVMVTLRLLAVEISPTRAICRNSMLILNSSSYNHEWWPVFEQLNCTVDAFLIADWAIKRNVLFDYITWEANWELFDFPLRLQSMYSLKCLSILTVTKIGDCDLWRRARLQIKKTPVSSFIAFHFFGNMLSEVHAWIFFRRSEWHGQAWTMGLRLAADALSFALEKIAVVSSWCYTFALWWECDRFAISLPLWQR